MNDENAKNIADLYSVNIQQANRIGVPQEKAPFVAVCLTMGDILNSSDLNMASRTLQRKVNRLRKIYDGE